jgi:hypothetical protein
MWFIWETWYKPSLSKNGLQRLWYLIPVQTPRGSTPTFL